MKKIHELTGKELEKLLTNMGKKAITEDHAAGRPTAHGDDKGTYLLYPDGRKIYIDIDLPYSACANGENCPRRNECERYVIFEKSKAQEAGNTCILSDPENCDLFIPIEKRQK